MKNNQLRLSIASRTRPPDVCRMEFEYNALTAELSEKIHFFIEIGNA